MLLPVTIFSVKSLTASSDSTLNESSLPGKKSSLLVVACASSWPRGWTTSRVSSEDKAGETRHPGLKWQLTGVTGSFAHFGLGK